MRYCANLGHLQDDESGLVCMRARYYEPTTGRFISEDPMHVGLNWYEYANGNPNMFSDWTGHRPSMLRLLAECSFFVLGESFCLAASVLATSGNVAKAKAAAFIGILCLGVAWTCSEAAWTSKVGVGILRGGPELIEALSTIFKATDTMIEATAVAAKTEVGPAVEKLLERNLLMEGLLAADIMESYGIGIVSGGFD